MYQFPQDGDDELAGLWNTGHTLRAIAKFTGKPRGTIRARIGRMIRTGELRQRHYLPPSPSFGEKLRAQRVAGEA